MLDTRLLWQKCLLPLSSGMGFKLGSDWVLSFGGDSKWHFEGTRNFGERSSE